ncbi:MFS transporter, partial [Candidatus Bathyarchaeota archaeon]|nr:MFS transporter [Candidatus Bathyarchaeota archaeon]
MATAKDRLRTFSSLRNPNFRWYWLAEFPYYSAMRMRGLAQSWLVYEMTKSPFLLGLVAAISGIPSIILALFGGILADRVKKKSLLFVAQAALGLNALALAILVSTGVVGYWHIVTLSLLNRITMTLTMPARLAFISEIVSEEEFMKAYALYYVALNLLGIIGPALAGTLVSIIGVAGVFYTVAACHFSFNGLLLMIKASRTATATPRPQSTSSIKKDITELLSFTRYSPPLLTLIGMKAALASFEMSAMTLMPVFASDILGVGVIGFGILQAAGGLGSLAGSLLIASIGETKRKALLLLSTGITRGMMLILFAISRIFYLSLAIRLFMGIASSVSLTLRSSLYQLYTTDELRGRVTSLYLMNFAPL